MKPQNNKIKYALLGVLTFFSLLGHHSWAQNQYFNQIDAQTINANSLYVNGQQVYGTGGQNPVDPSNQSPGLSIDNFLLFHDSQFRVNNNGSNEISYGLFRMYDLSYNNSLSHLASYYDQYINNEISGYPRLGNRLLHIEANIDVRSLYLKGVKVFGWEDDLQNGNIIKHSSVFQLSDFQNPYGSQSGISPKLDIKANVQINGSFDAGTIHAGTIDASGFSQGGIPLGLWETAGVTVGEWLNHNSSNTINGNEVSANNHGSSVISSIAVQEGETGILKVLRVTHYTNTYASVTIGLGPSTNVQNWASFDISSEGAAHNISGFYGYLPNFQTGYFQINTTDIELIINGEIVSTVARPAGELYAKIAFSSESKVTSIYTVSEPGMGALTTTKNVGIGTSSPAYPLDIAGSVNATEYLLNGTPLVNAWSENGANINYTGGHVGIGVTDPEAELDVSGRIQTDYLQVNSQDDGLEGGEIVLDGAGDYLSWAMDNHAGNMRIRQGNQNHFMVDSAGHVGIGTTTDVDHKLAVDGTMKTREITVTTENWPDYVFEEDYRLQPLSELYSYIREYGHLPEIPSQKEVEEEGVKLGELNAKLLQKIEELTLYIIKQDEMNSAQNQVLREMKAELLSIQGQ